MFLQTLKNNNEIMKIKIYKKRRILICLFLKKEVFKIIKIFSNSHLLENRWKFIDK